MYLHIKSVPLIRIKIELHYFRCILHMLLTLERIYVVLYWGCSLWECCNSHVHTHMCVCVYIINKNEALLGLGNGNIAFM